MDWYVTSMDLSTMFIVNKLTYFLYFDKKIPLCHIFVMDGIQTSAALNQFTWIWYQNVQCDPISYYHEKSNSYRFKIPVLFLKALHATPSIGIYGIVFNTLVQLQIKQKKNYRPNLHLSWSLKVFFLDGYECWPIFI